MPQSDSETKPFGRWVTVFAIALGLGGYRVPGHAALLNLVLGGEAEEIGLALPPNSPARRIPIDLSSPARMADQKQPLMRTSYAWEDTLHVHQGGSRIGDWGATSLRSVAAMPNVAGGVVLLSLEGTHAPGWLREPGRDTDLTVESDGIELAWAGRSRTLAWGIVASRSDTEFEAKSELLGGILGNEPVGRLELPGRRDAAALNLLASRRNSGCELKVEWADIKSRLELQEADRQATLPFGMEGPAIAFNGWRRLGKMSLWAALGAAERRGRGDVTYRGSATGAQRNELLASQWGIGATWVPRKPLLDRLVVGVRAQQASLLARGVTDAPGELGAAPGTWVSYRMDASYRMVGLHVAAEKRLTRPLTLRLGAQRWRAQVSGKLNYREWFLFFPKPPHQVGGELPDLRLYAITAGLSYRKGLWTIDWAVAQGFAEHSEQLHDLLGPSAGSPEQPNRPPRRTRGGLLIAVAVTKQF